MNMKFNTFIEEAIRNQIGDRESFLSDVKRIAGLVEIDEKRGGIKFSADLLQVISSFKQFRGITTNKLKEIESYVESQAIMLDY